MKDHTRWTVMIYLAGDSKKNLSAEMIFALEQIKEVKEIGPDKDVAVFVLFDPSGENYPTELYLINSNGSKPTILEEDLQRKSDGTIPIDADKSDPKKSVIEFVDWAVKKRPDSDRYMLVLSGHGGGAEADYLLPDQNPPGTLRLADLSEVVKKVTDKLEGKRLDILGMDSCLASMVETCHALCDAETNKPYVDYLVASEGFTPLTGWPYKEILQMLAGNPDKDPEQISKLLVAEYVKYYSNYVKAGVFVDLAAIKLSNYVGLARSVKELVRDLKAKVNTDETFRNAVQLAHLRAESYLDRKYSDLGDFCSCLSSLAEKGSEAITLSDRALELVKSAVVQRGTTLPDSGYSLGLAVYLPWTGVVEHYKTLSFAQYTGWHEFVATYLKMSRRSVSVPPGAAEQADEQRGGGDTKPDAARFLANGSEIKLGPQEMHAFTCINCGERIHLYNPAPIRKSESIKSKAV